MGADTMILYFKRKGDEVRSTESFVEVTRIDHQKDVIVFGTSDSDKDKILFKNDVVGASVFLDGTERVLF